MMDNLIKLTNAVYKVTELFPDKEPLKFAIRKESLDALFFYISFQKQNTAFQNQSHSLAIIQNKESLLQKCLDCLQMLKTYFAIASEQNWVNSRNFVVLNQEYQKLEEILKQELRQVKLYQDKIQRAAAALKEIHQPKANSPLNKVNDKINFENSQVAQPKRELKENNYNYTQPSAQPSNQPSAQPSNNLNLENQTLQDQDTQFNSSANETAEPNINLESDAPASESSTIEAVSPASEAISPVDTNKTAVPSSVIPPLNQTSKIFNKEEGDIDYENLSSIQLKVLELLQNNGQLKPNEIHKHFPDVNPRSIRRELYGLKSRHIISAVGSGRTISYKINLSI